MPVSLRFKRRGAYTNLDFLEGDVNLEINSSETIESIVVKAEGTERKRRVVADVGQGFPRRLYMLRSPVMNAQSQDLPSRFTR